MSNATKANTIAIARYNQEIKELDAQFEGGSVLWDEYISSMKKANEGMKESVTALNQYGKSTQTAINSANLFSTSVTALQTAFVASADLAYQNVDQLVSLYNAQIDVIRSQNVYTQALALQATAVSIYGSNSEQATRATTAANYVGALYTQSKMNETVAQEQYYTATAQNLSTIASSFVQMTGAMQIFQVAQAAMTWSSISESSDLELASIVPFAALAIAGGLTAYELLSQKAPTLSSPSMGSLATGTGESGVSRTGNYFLHQNEIVIPPGGSVGGGAASPNVEIHIHASSNVDLPRVRQEVQTAIAQSTLNAQKQRGVYG